MNNRLFLKVGEAPAAMRVVGPKGLARGKVVRNGGDFGAGMIAGVSLVTRGEALGHGMWLDSTFIDQVHESGVASGDAGLKARFAHPGLSDDGIGSVLGRWRNFRKSGSKQVYADLHLIEAAHVAPDGDLAEYVMQLAEDDPGLFAASIVYYPDEAAEQSFASENSDDQGRFISPDRENRANLPHARLAELLGADLVDEPAANPGGLFSRGNALPAEAEGLLAYALGLSETAPEGGEVLGVHPERARAFVTGFLERRGIQLNRGCAQSAQKEKTKDFDQRMAETKAGLAALEKRLAVAERKIRDMQADIKIGGRGR
jgi:hypothetical protein